MPGATKRPPFTKTIVTIIKQLSETAETLFRDTNFAVQAGIKVTI